MKNEENYILPFKALKTQAIAKKPIPTEANPQPATSSYLNAPRAIRDNPTIIIINVAYPKTVFLFIIGFYFQLFKRSKQQGNNRFVYIKITRNIKISNYKL
jgi:hypothetical protein